MREIKRGKRVKEIFSQDSAVNLSSDEEVSLLGIATSARMDHLELDQAITFKQNFIPYYRERASEKHKKLCDTAKEMEEIDAELDRLFSGFSKQFDLPLVDTK